MPSARTAPRRIRPTAAALAALGAALVVGLLHESPAPSSTPPAPPAEAPHGGTGATSLDRALGAALRRAEADAARDGITLDVTSGWRSPEHQERLLREAVERYGSVEEAARWVATPDTSPHVSGDAVDVANAAAAWLSAHGAAYGLCQIYVNEPWHYELRPQAAQQGCPPMYADPTHDPRMQR